MKLITRDQYRPMPWRNGGGTTHEIAVEPPDAGFAGGFLWRLSIADVATDGPFSPFPGYTRIIMLLQGNGMTLIPEHGAPLVLARPLEPASFSGDLAVTGRLHCCGPVKDFNLMVDAAQATGRIAVHQTPVELPMLPDSALLRAVFNPSESLSLTVVGPAGPFAVPSQAIAITTPGEPFWTAAVAVTSAEPAPIVAVEVGKLGS